MLALLQRVSLARVEVGAQTVGAIGPGLLVLVGVQVQDTPEHAVRMASRLLGYRIFDDAAARMNLDVTQTGGGVLLVPQFTLAADTRRGRRPGFESAAPPERAAPVFDALVHATRAAYTPVATGKFGAHMAVTLTNDGPVTFMLAVP